eukprot:m.106175 g.106175  ORF g.106175 m.106175 type:complete len:1315 (-) comp9148_c0_seq1:1654-5598(-)
MEAGRSFGGCASFKLLVENVCVDKIVGADSAASIPAQRVDVDACSITAMVAVPASTAFSTASINPNPFGTKNSTNWIHIQLHSSSIKSTTMEDISAYFTASSKQSQLWEALVSLLPDVTHSHKHMSSLSSSPAHQEVDGVDPTSSTWQSIESSDQRPFSFIFISTSSEFLHRNNNSSFMEVEIVTTLSLSHLKVLKENATTREAYLTCLRFALILSEDPNNQALRERFHHLNDVLAYVTGNGITSITNPSFIQLVDPRQYVAVSNSAKTSATTPPTTTTTATTAATLTATSSTALSSILLQNLPREIIVMILEKLPPLSLRRMKETSRLFQAIAMDITPGLFGLRLFPHQRNSVLRMIEMESRRERNIKDTIAPFHLRLKHEPLTMERKNSLCETLPSSSTPLQPRSRIASTSSSSSSDATTDATLLHKQPLRRVSTRRSRANHAGSQIRRTVSEQSNETVHEYLNVAMQAAQAHVLDDFIFIDPFSGNLFQYPPTCFPLIPGGLLCDQPGLGKTITLLALLLRTATPPLTSSPKSAMPPSSQSDAAISTSLTPQQRRYDMEKKVRFEQAEDVIATNPELLMSRTGLKIVGEICDFISTIVPHGDDWLDVLSTPVDLKAYPNYVNDIPHPPICITDIRLACSHVHKDVAKNITSLTQLKQQFQQLCENALAFNPDEEHPLNIIARKCLVQLDDLCLNVLPPLGEEGIEQLRLRCMDALCATLILVPDNTMVDHWESKFNSYALPAYLGLCVTFKAGTSPANRQSWETNTSAHVFRQLALNGVCICAMSLCAEAAKGPHHPLHCLLFNYKWRRVVVDEGHILGRGTSTRNASINSIHAKVWWLLTGTPVPISKRRIATSYLNRLLEKKTCPCIGDVQWKTKLITLFKQGNQLAALQIGDILKEVMIVHSKEKVLTIPPPVYYTHQLSMTRFEKECYKTIVNFIAVNLVLAGMQGARVSAERDSLLHTSNSSQSTRVLTNLRQACCGGFACRLILSEKHKNELLDKDLGHLPLDLRESIRLKLIGITRPSNPRPTSCDKCSISIFLPIFLPCGHLICPNCISVDSSECPRCYEMFDVDHMQRIQPGIDLRLRDLEITNVPSSFSLKPIYQERLNRKVKLCTNIFEKEEIQNSLKRRAFALFADSKAQYIIHRVEEHLKQAETQGEWGNQQTIKVLVFSRFFGSGNTQVQIEKHLEFHFGKKAVAVYRSPQKETAVRKFKNIESCRFLVIGSDGAVGLDLSFVTHIFLMEEVWDKAEESQVIARAWRMGCKQTVVVEKLIMDNSVEQILMQWNEEDEEGQTLISKRNHLLKTIAFAT